MSGVDCFMQGRRMSSRAGKDELGTRYFVSPTVCNQIHPKDTVRVDKVKDSKSSKPEKTKFWPGSELRFPSRPCPDPNGSLELRGLRLSVPGVCWDLTGVCTTGRGTEASFLAWLAESVPFLLLFSSPAWGQHHTQTVLSKRRLHAWTPLSGPGAYVLQTTVSASITSGLLSVLLTNQSHNTHTGKSHLPLVGT